MSRAIVSFLSKLIICLVLLFIIAAYFKSQQNSALKIVTEQQAQTAVIIPNIKLATKTVNESRVASNSILLNSPSAHDYWTGLQEKSNEFAPMTLHFPKPNTANLTIGTSGLMNKVKAELKNQQLMSQYTQINTALANTHRMLDYNAAVYKALTPLLGYNASTDFANYSKGSQDTNDREQAAKKGLANVEVGLKSQEGRYKDDNLDNEIKIVGQLKASLNNMINTGDVVQWTKDVQAAQVRILEKRIGFWETAKSSILSQLQTAQAYAESIQRLWTTI